MRTPSSQKCRLDLAPPWADRFILGVTPSIAARHFSAGPSDSTSRWTPCPPKYSKRWLQVGLGCAQLSPSCPFRPLHTFRFLRPARLRTPLLRYGAPHLSARGTSTLLNNALLSTHFRYADFPIRIRPMPNRCLRIADQSGILPSVLHKSRKCRIKPNPTPSRISG